MKQHVSKPLCSYAETVQNNTFAELCNNPKLSGFLLTNKDILLDALQSHLQGTEHPIGCLVVPFAGNRASYWMPYNLICREQGILLDALQSHL